MLASTAPDMLLSPWRFNLGCMEHGKPERASEQLLVQAKTGPLLHQTSFSSFSTGYCAVCAGYISDRSDAPARRRDEIARFTAPGTLKVSETFRGFFLV